MTSETLVRHGAHLVVRLLNAGDRSTSAAAPRALRCGYDRHGRAPLAQDGRRPALRRLQSIGAFVQVSVATVWKAPPACSPGAVSTSAREGITMSDKSPRKSNAKKPGKTLKEKRAAKKTKNAGKPSIIPPTGR
jgi:hypothetical protein